ncbi:TetR/AcrR family transcriptional regulator [Mycoplasmatota bacterium]|nr:TetR/AcrR family transcriptional regulator [Mycoplasmatota bacterium]
MAKTMKKTEGKDIKSEILTSAYKIMTEKGIKETSLKDIAKDLGISKGTLYYYYSAKADIIYDIADNHLNQMSERLLNWIDKINDQVSKELILEIVFNKLIDAQPRGKLHLYLLADAITENESLKQRFNERYNAWRNIIEEGLNKVYVKSKNKKLVSYLIMLVIDGLTIQKLLGQDKLPIHELSEMILNID